MKRLCPAFSPRFPFLGIGNASTARVEHGHRLFRHQSTPSSRGTVRDTEYQRVPNVVRHLGEYPSFTTTEFSLANFVRSMPACICPWAHHSHPLRHPHRVTSNGLQNSLPPLCVRLGNMETSPPAGEINQHAHTSQVAHARARVQQSIAATAYAGQDLRRWNA